MMFHRRRNREETAEGGGSPPTFFNAGARPLTFALVIALGSRVVSVLDSGAEGPGSNRSRDAVG